MVDLAIPSFLVTAEIRSIFRLFVDIIVLLRFVCVRTDTRDRIFER